MHLILSFRPSSKRFQMANINTLVPRQRGGMAAMSSAPLFLANTMLTSKLQDDDVRYAEPVKNKNRDYE